MAGRNLTDPPEQLTDSDKKSIKSWVKQQHPTYVKKLTWMWDQCRDWHLANGVQRADWAATFRRWIRRQVEYEADQARSKRDVSQDQWDSIKSVLEADRKGNQDS